MRALEAALAPLESFDLVGHSMGATLALPYAALHPEKVRRLILISLPLVGRGRRARNGMRRRLPGGWFFTNTVLSGLACLRTRWVVRPLLPLLLPRYPRDVLRGALEHNVLGFVTSLREVVYKHDSTRDARQLGAAIDVLCPDKSARIPPVRELAENFPNWRMLELPEADHHPLLFDLEECPAAIRAALQNRSSPPGERTHDETDIE